MTSSCPKCGGGMMEFKVDEFGPYLRCYFCGKHVDLLQDAPEVIRLRMKIDHHWQRQEVVRVAATVR